MAGDDSAAAEDGCAVDDDWQHHTTIEGGIGKLCRRYHNGKKGILSHCGWLYERCVKEES